MLQSWRRHFARVLLKYPFKFRKNDTTERMALLRGPSGFEQIDEPLPRQFVARTRPLVCPVLAVPFPCCLQITSKVQVARTFKRYIWRTSIGMSFDFSQERPDADPGYYQGISYQFLEAGGRIDVSLNFVFSRGHRLGELLQRLELETRLQVEDRYFDALLAHLQKNESHSYIRKGQD